MFLVGRPPLRDLVPPYQNSGVSKPGKYRNANAFFSRELLAP